MATKAQNIASKSVPPALDVMSEENKIELRIKNAAIRADTT